ncbi:hypothetical protein [Faecalispora anaeroviscerum]|uniref:hypothetical protein n=1 Tax=Faecalispora anaeroviscerum TaxID=2991836 RepID=UPI0024BA07B5|nr:hypothetical protein [Faecalispora anaeroviscerum]
MIIRKVCQEQYEQVCRYLNQQGKSGTFDASYEVTIQVDDCEYLLRLQPCSKRKLAALQAVQLYRKEKERRFKLITENLPLSTLLELFLFQQKKNTAESNLN